MVPIRLCIFDTLVSLTSAELVPEGVIPAVRLGCDVPLIVALVNELKVGASPSKVLRILWD